MESLSGTRIEQDRATQIDVDHAIGERHCLDLIKGDIDHGRRDLLVERRALAYVSSAVPPVTRLTTSAMRMIAP